MYSESLVHLALTTLSCSQKELALRLKVSPTQISKWKKGEHMSLEMEDRFRELLGIGEKDPVFIMLSGSIKSAEKWEKLLSLLSDMAYDCDETGYINHLLTEDKERLCTLTFSLLKSIGLKSPFSFPEELENLFDIDGLKGNEDEEVIWESIDKYEIISTIYKIFVASNDVYGFYAAYVSDLIFDEDIETYDSSFGNIEGCLLSLAACKVDIDESFAPAYKEYKRLVLIDYEEWLNELKIKAFRAGIPLKAELLKMVYSSGDLLGHEAERESLGFNSNNLHPDIYMNELLTGMRIIHQVLPAIMKKLGIDDDFELDASAFHIE